MGIGNPLFLSNDPTKETLLRRCTPSTEQREEQQARIEELREFLVEEVADATGKAVDTRLQGSFKYGTQIRPSHQDFDVDLGLNVIWSGNSNNSDFNPSDLKDIVNEALQSFAAQNPQEVEIVEPQKPRCCRIKYRNHFHIDVPVYHLNPLTDDRKLATSDNTWEPSDPKKLYLWFKNQFSDNERVQVRRLVQYAKAWAAVQFPEEANRPSSVMLTVLVADAVKEIGADNLGPDDEAFAEVIEAISERMDGDASIANPVLPREDLAEKLNAQQMATFKHKLSALSRLANRAVFANSLSEASLAWGDRTAFGFLFPRPEGVTEVANNNGLPVPFIQPHVNVTAVNASGGIIARGVNMIGDVTALPKDCNVEFEIMNGHQLPTGAEIHWIVRNEGREAELANSIGHYAGTGLRVSRPAAFNGRHFMDCEISIAGSIVAFRRIPVIIRGITIPPRNVTKQPTYRQFNGRRRR